MHPTTRAHLHTAERNAAIAHELLNSTATTTPPPHDWAVVLSFYAAVHYVNAYLWETQRYEPRSHDERHRAIAIVTTLRPVYPAYLRLSRTAFDARYKPHFRISEQDARRHLDDDLAVVESAVRAALEAV